MAKLFATLETSTGKTVSVSDNEQIVATLYDGNMKAYEMKITFFEGRATVESKRWVDMF